MCVCVCVCVCACVRARGGVWSVGCRTCAVCIVVPFCNDVFGTMGGRNLVVEMSYILAVRWWENGGGVHAQKVCVPSI